MMQLVILAGGKGTRISEESYLKPKPLIEIGGMPIIWHLMKIYSYHGINEFIICGGYKCNLIKDFFSNYIFHKSDIEIDIFKNKIKKISNFKLNWKIIIADTGLETQTGGRLKRIQKYLKGNHFCMTYGDGLSDINIKKLISFHRSHKKLATVTAIQPVGKFGAINIVNNNVINFREKPKGDGQWINGGFFVLNKKIFSYIDNDQTIWERQPLEKLSQNNELKAFKHNGFWQSMDTLNDKNTLEKIWSDQTKRPPWKKWND